MGNSSEARREDDSRCVGHEPCPKCGSRDNLARYDDGHGFCFGCKYFEPGDSERKEAGDSKLRDDRSFVSGEVPDGGLTSRRISEETCRKFGYWIGRFKGKPVQIANYRSPKTGKIVSQKLRFKKNAEGKKKFLQVGDTDKAGLYGQHLWKPGRRLVITEGEIDALSLSQAMNNRWPVVSVRNGASGAAKDIAEQIEFVSSFEAVVLMFDMDKAGRAAATEAAAMLPPGKAFIAELPLKDANEMLLAGRARELVSAAWEARPYRPDGIIDVDDVYDEVVNGGADDRGLAYPFDGLNKYAKGMRRAEIITLTMGTGCGKTTLAKELAYHLHWHHKERVGLLMLEERKKRTVQSILGLHMNKRLHLEPSTPAEKDKAWKELFAGDHKIHLYDHWGSTEIENLLSKIRFLAVGRGCKWIVLDHLSIVVSGLDVGDERKAIDVAVTKLRSLVDELNIGLIMLVHLSRPKGDKGFEQGMRPRLQHLRGSGGIAQISDIVITGAPGGKNQTKIWIEKNRFDGDDHKSEDEDPIMLQFDKQTGRMSEIPFFEDETEDDDEDEEESSPIRHKGDCDGREGCRCTQKADQAPTDF